jgi:hypothetical protein
MDEDMKLNATVTGKLDLVQCRCKMRCSVAGCVLFLHVSRKLAKTSCVGIAGLTMVETYAQ